MSTLPEVSGNGERHSIEPEVNGTGTRNANDLLRLVYELPKEFTDGTWDSKPGNLDPSDASSKLTPNNDTVGGLSITSHVRAKIEMSNVRTVTTTNISLKDVMNSNNALRLNRTARSDIVDDVFDDPSDSKTFNNQTINVTECSSPTRLNNNNIERCSFSGSPTNVSVTQKTLSPRKFSSSPIDLSPYPLSDISDEEIDTINRTLSTNPELLERWLKEKASPDILKRVHAISEPPIVSSGSKRTSVTSELFQLWLASSPVKVFYFVFTTRNIKHYT